MIHQEDERTSEERDTDQSLSAWLYDQMRTLIIEGTLPPGSRLRERELAERFNVSRMPLREALPQLEAEGFVVTSTRRGAIVTQLTLRDVSELFDVRLGVEVAATRLAAKRVAAGVSPAPLHNRMTLAVHALAGGDPAAIASANADLHEAIVELADNSLLTNMMRSVAGRDRWIFRLTSSRDPAQACSEHQQLCEAIAVGDPDLAGAVAYSHIERGRTPTIRALESILPPDAEAFPDQARSRRRKDRMRVQRDDGRAAGRPTIVG